MDFISSIWDIIVLFFWAFIFIASLFAVILVLTDLFRDKKLNGWAKAAWLLFLVFVPLLTSLVYMIARSDGMSERIDQEAPGRIEASESYIREVAGDSPVEEIAKAKELLDAGAITEGEFSTLKSRVLAVT